MVKRLLSSLLVAAAALVFVGCSSGTVSSGSLETLSTPSKTLTLADFKGKVVLIDFWATWCSPCRDTMPIVEDLYKTYAGKGLEVVAITNEDRATVEAFRSSEPYTYPVYLDTAGAVTNDFGINAIPTFVVLDKSGRELGRIESGNKADFVEMIEKALKD